MDSRFSALQARARTLRDPEAMHGLLVASLRAGLLTMWDLTTLWAMGTTPEGLEFDRSYATEAWITEIAGQIAGHRQEAVPSSDEDARNGNTYYAVLSYPVRCLATAMNVSVRMPRDFDAAILLCRAVQEVVSSRINTIQTGYEVVTPNTRRIDAFQHDVDVLLDELQDRGPAELVSEDFRGVGGVGSGGDRKRWHNIWRTGGHINMLQDDSEGALEGSGSNPYTDYVAQAACSYGDCVLRLMLGGIAYHDFDTIMAILPTFELPTRLRNTSALPRSLASIYLLRDLVWSPMVLWFLRYRGVL